MTLKEQLYKQTKAYIIKRVQTVETIISAAQNALSSETKSSAGDKHETGRAMLQLEMEKAGKQLHDINLMKETFAKVDISKPGDIIRLGSLVKTSTTSYFIAISAGELTIDLKKYYAISLSTPIGRLLLGKKTGDTITFNKKTIEIIDVN